jgi:hypothetical protein
VATVTNPDPDYPWDHYPIRFIRMGQGRDICAYDRKPWPCQTIREYEAKKEEEKEDDAHHLVTG